MRLSDLLLSACSLPRLCLFFLALAVLGCSARSPDDLFTRYGIGSPAVQHVRVCVSYACRHHEVAGFEPWEWELVVQKMHPEQNDSPELERDRISKTVGLMEEIIGPKVGTQYNKARNRPGPKGTRQLDCIAETVNTTIYLTLLEDEHLLLYHQVAGPAKRGPMNLTFWHYSAVVKETIPGRRFAVDPWFNDNGHPATVVPLDEWLSGYSPD